MRNTVESGWNRMSSGLDVEVVHGIPVRVSSTNNTHQSDEIVISEKISALTGLAVSVSDWKCISTDEQEWSVCIDKKEFREVLHRLALASAAMFVERYHKPIDKNAVDWDSAEFDYDFNHALEHCCIPMGSVNKKDYIDRYLSDMHTESERLVAAGIAPFVEAE